MMDSETYGKKEDQVSYLHFRSTFIRLAAKLWKHRYSRKSAFELRISPTLQKSFALQFLDENVQFDSISKLAHKIDYTNITADAVIRARPGANKSSSNSD